MHRGGRDGTANFAQAHNHSAQWQERREGLEWRRQERLQSRFLWSFYFVSFRCSSVSGGYFAFVAIIVALVAVPLRDLGEGRGAHRAAGVWRRASTRSASVASAIR